MRNLLEFLSRYNYWLLFFFLEAISLFLLFRFNVYQGSIWFSSANVVTAKVLEWEADVLSYIHLRDNNKMLLQRNLVLEQRVEQLARELDTYRHQPNAEEEHQTDVLKHFDMIDAQVVNSTVYRRNNYITINKGALDGVRPEMGVVCGTGVVGIVYATSSHYSIVLPLLNGKSNVSCQLRDTEYFGYLQWNGEHPLYATLEDIPRHAKVEEGMAVETSGFSAVFPPGLFVGRVKQVDNSEDGLTYQLNIHLSTDFAKLHHVSVLVSEGMDEMKELEKELN